MNYPAYLQNILRTAVSRKASDLHISVGHSPILRITRILTELKQEPRISSRDAQGLAFCLMNKVQQERFLREKGIDFAYAFDLGARFRVNVFFQSGNVGIALRIVSSKIRTIKELNLPLILERFTQAQQGFVLITGASSQGKSTTLAALIDQINHQRREHIITIEDPIEYVFEDDKSIVDQRELGQDFLNFAKALRATLRGDPNVIMVGEMRDLETISTAITAAETGHLVFATLHTNSASQSIHRLIDVFPGHQQNQIKAQLANSILGVISQRLLPRIKNGFVPACEIMFRSSAITNLIREGKIHEIPSIIETSAEAGMVTLNKSLAELFHQGQITEETALNFSLNPEDLKGRL